MHPFKDLCSLSYVWISLLPNMCMAKSFLIQVPIKNQLLGFPQWLSGKNLPADAGDIKDMGSISGSSGGYPQAGNCSLL